jgi:hypothetical protein
VDKQTFDKGLSGSSVAIGVVAVIAPRAMQRAYGSESTPESRVLLQLMGTRNVVLGALLLMTPEPQREDWWIPLIAMNGVDAICALAGLRGGAAPRAAVQTAATSAIFGALGLYRRSLA